MFLNQFDVPNSNISSLESVWLLDVVGGGRQVNEMSGNLKFPSGVASSVSLSQGSSASSDLGSSQQSLISPQQLTTMVSIPQNFCFTSQPNHVSIAGQPQSAMNVTLGFPVGATSALSTGALPQHFVQSLSVGQQPTICASLPQGLSFPLNQTLFTVSSPNSAASPFLSAPFNQFAGLPSLIMSGQQSLIPNALMGPASQGASTTAQLQTLGSLSSQSITFPVSSGPVVSEITHEHHHHHQHLQALQQSQTHPFQLHSQPLPQSQLLPIQSHSAVQPQQPTLSSVQEQTDRPSATSSQNQPAQEETVLIHLPDTDHMKSEESRSDQSNDKGEDATSAGTIEAGVVDQTSCDDSQDKQERKECTCQEEEVEERPRSPEVVSKSAELDDDSGHQPLKEEIKPTSSLLTSSEEKETIPVSVKQESMEVKPAAEEEEEMPLPDSTPTEVEGQGSPWRYSHRESPSPMASLQLTRADTTTTSTTRSSSYWNEDRQREYLDVKQLALKDHTQDGVPFEFDEAEFVWEDYLQETGATAVPPTAFKHVECSVQSGFSKGMKLEVANKAKPDTFWVASIVMTCGPLLRLRYEGYEEDGSADFWSDLTTCQLHPVGWCEENGKKLVVPEALKDKHSDWPKVLQESLKGAKMVPSYLLDKNVGTTPIDQLKQGMRLELQNTDNPTHVWLVRIIENVGGRLYLRLEGMDSGQTDFWAFYLHECLHPIGWAKQMGYSYHPPRVLEKNGLSEKDIQHILETALKEAEEQNLPADIFKDQATVVAHKFRRGMKLEAVNPRSRNSICPATVIEVIDSRYFTVEIDDLQETDISKRIRLCCHSRTPTIFPIQWTVYKGIKLTPPPGWAWQDFNWQEYLAHTRTMAAPDSYFDLQAGEHEFVRGMKLEAVNPDCPNQICAATITKIVDHLMWVHLDSSTRIVASHVEHTASHNLFPVGWCESNGYQLRPPHKSGLRGGVMAARKRVAVVQPELTDGVHGREEGSEALGCTYCPKIFFNHKCFSGPYLSKGRIAELPRSVGPGPLQLVMKEVLSMLISVAYKSCRVLREIQLDGPPNPSMHQQVLKAKYKSKSYGAVVEICRTTAKLEDYCRQVCIKLECCPNLISPHAVGDNCPENCSQLTKTKYTYYYGKKKKKIGRPPGGHTNLENGAKKSVKRRKRGKIGPLVSRKSHSLPGDEDEEGCDEDKASIASDTRTVDSSSTATSRDQDPDTTASVDKRLKRKYTHHIPPPSEIRTRGAKLPRYSFERRTHKKILLSQPSQIGSTLRTKALQKQKIARAATPEMIARPRPATPLPLDKNPLHWTIADTVEFIRTTDCSHVAKVFKEQEIDGQALLLLTLPTVQEHLELKLGPAIKLCHQIERVKQAFYEQYASQSKR